MKLHSLKLKGIGRFHEETALPVEQLDGAEVVALVGLNGTGKTTAMEALPGVLYGAVPSHGALARFANAADSYVQAQIETDQVYRLTQKINAVRKQPKTEAYIIDEAGKPLNDQGKIGTFDAEVAKRFPPQSVFLASGFAAQKRNGQFLEIAKADRKALFVEMLGLGCLQTLSDLAGKKARDAEAEISSDQARSSTLKAQAEALDPDTGQTPETALRGAEARLAKATEARIEADELAEKAKAENDRWLAELAEMEKATLRAESAHREAGQRSTATAGALSVKEKALTRLSVEQAQLTDRLAKADVYREQEAKGAEAADRITEVEKQAESAREAQEAYNKARIEWRYRKAEAVAARREYDANRAIASGLGDVPCSGEGEFSACPLISTASQAAKDRPRLGEAAQRAHEAIGDEPTPPEPVDLKELDAEIRSLRGTVATATQAQAKLETLEDARYRIAELDGEAGDLRGEIIEARGDLLDAHREKARTGLVFDEALGAHREYGEVRPPTQTAGEVERARQLETGYASEVARMTERLKTTQKAAEELAAIEARLSGVIADLDDWRHLQKAYGKDGIQALEVDAAGPEISDLINGLLVSCYGSRFSASLETAELRKDGKGTKETFDLRIIDTEMGTDGSAEELSGGERVIVAEALSLAIAIYHAGKSHIPILDLWRDECCGALDYEKAPLYVTMLRKALEVGGFHRVYFVAHNQELWGLADQTIVFKDGSCALAGISRESVEEIQAARDGSPCTDGTTAKAPHPAGSPLPGPSGD